MIKYILLLFFLLSVLKVNSQNLEEFDLPQGENKISKINNDINFEIHLKNNGVIYLNRNKIKLQNLADSIINIKSKAKIQNFTSLNPIVFIENNTYFENIEEIKEELSRAWVFSITYRTKNKNYYSGYKRKLHMSSNYIKRSVFLKNENNYEIKLDTANFYGLDWVAQLEFDLYSKKLLKARSLIKSKKYLKLKIIDKNYFEVDGVKIKFNNLNFTKSIKNQDIIFIHYDKKLKYEDYLNFLFVLNDVEQTRINFQNNFSVERKKLIPFIEISNNLLESLRLNNFKL